MLISDGCCDCAVKVTVASPHRFVTYKYNKINAYYVSRPILHYNIYN